MTKTIAVTNQKGGVGKTTTSLNLSASLAKLNKKVLLVDYDPQANATTGLGIEVEENQDTIYDVLIDNKDINKSIINVPEEGFDIIPGDINLSSLDAELANKDRSYAFLKDALERLTAKYDYIFIDCPPSLGVNTVNALTAATDTIIPIQCEFYALEGLHQVLNLIDLVKEKMNPDLKVDGVIFTMFDTRTRLSKEVVDTVYEYLGGKIFETKIPRNVRLAEAPSYGKSIIQYDPQSIGAESYVNLAKELIKRIEGEK